MGGGGPGGSSARTSKGDPPVAPTPVIKVKPRHRMVKQVDLPAERADALYLGSLWGFLMVTLRNFWGRKGTSRYPEEKPADSGTGLPQLTLDEQGRIRCVACYLCSSACPAACISIEAGQAPWDDRQRFPQRFEIDARRCIFCGLCALACPVDALSMGERRPLATRQGQRLVLGREQLRAG